MPENRETKNRQTNPSPPEMGNEKANSMKRGTRRAVLEMICSGYKKEDFVPGRLNGPIKTWQLAAYTNLKLSKF